MSRVAVVEDEELIRTMLKINLERAGHQAVCFGDAESMLSGLKEESFDIVLLDIRLPGISGKEALKQLRAHGFNMPVLMLTAVRDVESRIFALDNGADDYLSKPFNMDELLARVRALIRRSQGERVIPSDNTGTIHEFIINFDTHIAESNIGTVTLSAKEINLLKFLMRNPSRTLPRNDILEEVWGMDVDPTPRTIDNFIMKFRKLFEENSEHPRHFITVRAEGYRFEP